MSNTDTRTTFEVTIQEILNRVSIVELIKKDRQMAQIFIKFLSIYQCFDDLLKHRNNKK